MPNRIRELRKGRGWTQEQLAQLVDTHHTTIQRLESGTRQLNERWVRALAKVFHCHPGELFESLPQSRQPEEAGELDRQELRSYRIAREILESMNRHGLEHLSEVEVHTYAEAISRALFHPEMADDKRRRQFVDSKLFDIRQYKKLKGREG